MVSTVFEHLNGSDTRLGPESTETAADLPRRRVLHRLGEYVELIVRPLNMRPRITTLMFEDAERIEVRVSTEATHVLVVIAPEGDLASELFFMRMLGGQHLPVPRLITADLSCATVPCSYIVEGHVAGRPLSSVAEPALIKVAARQVGRALRLAHNRPVPGFGKPSPAGRWRTRAWVSVLNDWLTRNGARAQAVAALGEDLSSELWAATLDNPALDWFEPRLIHGAPFPSHAMVTVGGATHLEALVRPGEIVGGDPLFDLAMATLPRHATVYQQGIYEGYTSVGMLSPPQRDRFQRLRLLLHTTDMLANADASLLRRLPGMVSEALWRLNQPT